jgi:hypothetical protein
MMGSATILFYFCLCCPPAHILMLEAAALLPMYKTKYI